MPAPRRAGSSNGGGGGLLDVLDERARSRPVDNFSSVQTYYRSAALHLRQVSKQGWAGCCAASSKLGRQPPLSCRADPAACLCRRRSRSPPPSVRPQAELYRMRHNDAELYVHLLRFVTCVGALAAGRGHETSARCSSHAPPAGSATAAPALPPSRSPAAAAWW